MNSSPKRLAVFLGGLYGGGAERIILNLLQGLAERDYQVDLVLARAVGPYLSQIPDKVRLVDLHASRALFCLPALVQYLRSEQPAALLSAINYANIIALWAHRLARISTRIVISEHNNFTVSSQNMAKFFKLLLPTTLRLFYSWADRIIAVSQGVADDMSKAIKIPRERIEVIYNPIILPILEEKANERLDHPWFLPGQPPVVIAIGRLTRQKDFPTLIQSFDRVRKIRPARLMILGEGQDRETLSSLVTDLGLSEYVSMPGFVQNPYAYLARASVFVLSSRWEGLPTVLVEALFCNVPVVSTDCPNGPNEILHDGKYGILVPVGNPESLAQGILSALDGGAPIPQKDSWLPFEIGTVVEQYEKVLLY